MAGRYEVLEVLGAGGVAQVVRARRRRDGPDGPDIALKVLRAELVDDADAVRRFRDEARILVALDHPGVVRAHRLLSYGGRLVMELDLVRGATLDDALGALGPVPAPAALAVVRQVAEALRAAWDAPGEDGAPMRLVHRDLKPANLALSLDDGRVRLLDFGYAKGAFAGRAAQSIHDAWGTIGFDAPERKEGRTAPAADVYALGVTLYVALTTRPVLLSMRAEHHDRDLAELLDHLVCEELDQDALRGLVRDCVRHDPDARPDMATLVERLAALCPPDRADAALAAFCTAEVRGLWAERVRVLPGQDRQFEGLRFLSTDAPDPEQEPIPAAVGRQRLVALLAEEGWARRLHAFDPLVEACPELPADPLLAVLDRARVPFWKQWVRRATPAEIEGALLLLARVAPEVARARATALLAFDDPRVRRAARFVVDGAGGFDRSPDPT